MPSIEVTLKKDFERINI